jgi:DNA primase
MSYLDFAAIKAANPIEAVAERLGLALKKRGEQLRGPCPVCQSGGDRALVVTPSKAAFYCFAGRAGGDAISLVAHLHGLPPKEAAHWISGEAAPAGAARTETVPNERKGHGERRLLQPLTYLEAEHPSLKALGLAAETLQRIGAGYAPKGILRGRLAIPIHDRDGALVAYAGRAVSAEQEPKLAFPSGFDPEAQFFNAHRLEAGELTLTRDPLEALLAMQAGIDNVVALLTGTATAGQLRALAALMDECGIETLEVY